MDKATGKLSFWAGHNLTQAGRAESDQVRAVLQTDLLPYGVQAEQRID
jgi:hypothetical protein